MDVRLGLLEADVDDTSANVDQIKRILWTLVTGVFTSGLLFAIDLAVRVH